MPDVGPPSSGPRPPEPGRVAADEPPPFGASWAALYAAVAACLALLIALFEIFTKAFE